jgi:uncharacterized protein (DUF952 family)
MTDIAYKVLTATEWKELAGDAFQGSPIDQADGFIHLSTGAQLTETVDCHFCGQEGLVIVAIELKALGDSLRWEASRHGQLFPHFYGQLRLGHVNSACPLERYPDGTVRLPGAN